MKCIHCELEIAPIKDSCGFTTWQGRPYGYHHVAATDNNDGRFSRDCADGQNEAEPAPSPAPACVVTERSKLYAQY